MAGVLMVVAFILLTTLTTAQNNTIVTLYDGANCSSDAPQYVWEPRAQDATSDGGNCIQSLPATALSLMFSHFQPGCTATVYSDVYCSYNATLAEIDSCADLSATSKIRSLSIDGCDVPFSESGTTSNNTTPSTEDPHHGISSAAKGGIGAGVGCGVLLLVAVGLTFWLKRRRSTSSLSAPVDGKSEPHRPTELSGEQIFELSSPRGSEMPTEKEKQEMPTKPSMAELRSKSSVRLIQPQELEGHHP